MTNKKRVEFADKRLFSESDINANDRQTLSKNTDHSLNDQELFDKLENAYQVCFYCDLIDCSLERI